MEPPPCYTRGMSAGFFVTFEGLDGSGKSTQLRKLAQSLESQGTRVTVTRQPGGTRIGDRIRTLLLDSRTEKLSPRAELGLMFSDRAQAIAEIIRPALDRGDVVLCDRFTDSTEAYQGGGRQLGSDVVLQLHAAMCQGLQPDLTFCCCPISSARSKGHAAETRETPAKVRMKTDSSERISCSTAASIRSTLRSPLASLPG